MRTDMTSLVRALRSKVNQTTEDALCMLVEMIDSVDDADAAALCKQLRSLNAIEAICRLVDHEHDTIHQLSLLDIVISAA